MINLFDNYNQETEYLLASLWRAGYFHPTIIIEDNGFLPEQVISPIQFFMGELNEDGQRIMTSETHHPRYFNQVPFPRFWELSGDNSSGEIRDYDKLRAKIHYNNPKHKRHVSAVEWLDRDGRVRIVDGYNQYGRKYRETTFSKIGKAIVTRYLHISGADALSYNHVTGDYVLNYKNKIKIFQNKVDFVKFFIKEAEYELDKVFINSLATPFLVVNDIEEEGQNILFWQEPFYNDLPDNMKVLLYGGQRSGKVIIPNKQYYEKGISLANDEQRNNIHKLGYVYDWHRENENRKNALILTNSDQISNLQKIVESLPEMNFYIGAITEMSSKLANYGKYENVKLYPNIKDNDVDKLFEICDYYLDINFANEILNATQRAFLNKMLIMSFRNTLHAKDYISEEMVFESSDADTFINKLKELLSDKNLALDIIEKQSEKMNAVSVEDYKNVLGEPDEIYR